MATDPQKPQELALPAEANETLSAAKIRWLTLALLIILPCLLYGHTLRFEPVLDDENYVLANPLLRDHQSFLYPWNFKAFATSGDNLGQSRDMALNFITRPVTYLTFYANRISHGSDPAGYRVINILIHICNGLLLFLLLEKLTGKGSRATLAAALAALLFAVHPMATESVTYITQRFESLSTLFCLLAVLSYVLYRNAPSSRSGKAYLGLSLLASGLSMLSKETGFVVPWLIIAVEYFGFQSSPTMTWRRTWKHLLLTPILPILIIATDYAQTGIRPTLSSLLHVTNHVQDGHNTTAYFLTQVSAWLTYLRLWLLPVGQNFDHDYPKIISVLQPAFIGALSGVLSIVGFIILAHRRSAGRTAFITIGALWFILSLAPSSSLFALPDLFSEHRSYFPSIGLFLALSVWLFQLFNTKVSQHWKTSLQVIYPVILLTLCLATLLRNEVLRTRENIWQDSLAKGTNNARVWKGLGIAKHQLGRPKEAIECFKNAVAVKPLDMESWYNLNTAYLKTGMHQEALDSTQKSLEYLGGNTHLLHLRALALTNAGWPDEGRKIWELILQYIPGNRDANISLAEFFAKTGRHEQALYHFNAAEKSGPLSSTMSEIKRTLQAQLSTMR